MVKQWCRAIVLVAILIAAVATACSSNTAKKNLVAGGAQPLAEGETLGKIEHLPGGTAVASNVITLLNMTCTNGQIVVRTNLKSIVGKMDCAQSVPDATLEHFYGQSVSISYANGRLRVESVSAGSLDLPVREATSRDAHATP